MAEHPEDQLAAQAAAETAAAAARRVETARQGESANPAQTWLWGVVGVVVLVAVAGGLMLGFIGGRLFQPAPTPTLPVADVESLFGARLVNTPDGVLISRVISSGPAVAAGLQAGDVLVSIDAELVENREQVAAVLAGYEPGDTVLVVVRRDYALSETLLMLGISAARPIPVPPTVRSIPPEAGRLGVKYRMVEPSNGSEGGALVVSFLDVNTPAERYGLQPGDVITRVEGSPIAYQGDLESALRAFGPGDRVRVMIIRAGEQLTLSVTLG